MDDTNAVLRATFDHRVELARDRLDWALDTLHQTEFAYAKALKATSGIDDLDEFRYERESAQIAVARCQCDLDRMLDWRAHETGAPR